jgi:hypothetical protein
LNTSTIKNALTLERQKDLYDENIIPAAFDTISGPTLQEIPRTYEIAYAKSRSFLETPDSSRRRADDEIRRDMPFIKPLFAISRPLIARRNSPFPLL